jgi:restriction system protein
MKLPENSLFAVLLRSPWWISLAVAAGAFGLMRLFLPASYAAFGAAPFVVIAFIAAWRRLRVPSARRVAARLEAMRAMSREEFAARLEDAFRREGYQVRRVDGPQADLELTRAGRVSLVTFRRWKATRTGVDPLREVLAAAKAREVQECIYVAAGEVTHNARAFAAQEKIRLLDDAELARLLAR